MRKALAFLLLISVLLSVTMLSLAEEEESRTFTSGDWECYITDDGTLSIRYLGNDNEVVVPEKLDGRKVTDIGDSAFAFCESLTSVTIPDGVTSIGGNAFCVCSSLISVTIPDSVTYIGESTFCVCTSLTSVTIPDSVMCIDGNPFVLCDKLTEIVVSPDHMFYETIDGVLISKPDMKLVCYPCAFREETYQIPDGVMAIGNGAFHSCKALTSITIPDSVTSIGVLAFAYCGSMTSITIPDSVTSIGAYAFTGCESLTSVTIPDSVTSIGEGAFSFCGSLTSVTIPDSVTSIGDDAFAGCESLTATVGRNSYAEQYCAEKGIKYTYADASAWLND